MGSNETSLHPRMGQQLTPYWNPTPKIVQLLFAYAKSFASFSGLESSISETAGFNRKQFQNLITKRQGWLASRVKMAIRLRRAEFFHRSGSCSQS